MVDLTSTTVPIIIALIGSGSILITGITGYISSIDKPNINFEVKENDNQSIIEITNTGKKPATNLELTLLNKELINQPIIFSTENISKFILNSKSLRMDTHRFVQGDGSFIRLTLNSTIDQIENMYATYDEGSKVLSKKITIIDTLFNTFIFIGWILVILIGSSFFLLTSVGYFLFRKNKRNRDQKQKNKMRHVLINMIDFRSFLYTDIKTKKKFEFKDLTWSSLNSISILGLNNIKELIIIDDCYMKLKMRNTILESSSIGYHDNQNDDTILRYNLMCLYAIQNTLFNIDWDKYKLFDKKFIDTVKVGKIEFELQEPE